MQYETIVVDVTGDGVAPVAALPPVAVQRTVKAFWQSLNLGRDQSLSSAFLFAQIGQSDRDCRSRPQSGQACRPPHLLTTKFAEGNETND